MTNPPTIQHGTLTEIDGTKIPVISFDGGVYWEQVKLNTMTKEEIITKFTDEWVGGMTNGDLSGIVYPAMEEYAKQQAIAFHLWCVNEGLEKYLTEHTGEQLYNSFIESLKTKDK